MRYIYRLHLVIASLIALCIISCDDNTGSMGIVSDKDGISNSISLYNVTTRSLQMDSVEANSSYSYLGNIIDPETGTTISASYAAQYYCFEGYKYPALSQMVAMKIDEKGDTVSLERGKVQCDSCELRIYFDDYYGEGNNPMKLRVYALSEKNLLNEDSTYYTNTDMTQFLADKNTPLAERVFTPMDYNLSESELGSSFHSHNVAIRLDNEIGTKIIQKYFDNPKNFQDSYNFIRNVCPGFYFTISNGDGTMMSVYAGTFNVYFHYADAESDSIFTGMSRFAATPEVIQSTHFDNSDMSKLIDLSEATYLKTPAGICTEMTLPIDEIFSGEHAADSVNLATITLTRYNKEPGKFHLDTPQEILMVRKGDMHSFFKNHEVTNSRTSYTAIFDPTYNTYSFTNICRLLAYAKNEKINAVKARLDEEYTEEEFKAEEAKWVSENPDWNKVCLIPVKCSYVTTTDNSGNTVKKQSSVNHDLGLNSIRLVGGKTALQMQVVYSKFKNQE